MRRCARIDVARIQNAARNAMEWFEVVGARYADTLEPEQFMYSLLTRSQRISHENLRLRDRAWLEGYERWFAARAGVERRPAAPRRRRRCSRRSACAVLTLPNRIVVSPMAMYSAEDGVPGDFHLVHLGARAHGRRRAGVRRDDLRLARRAHHARAASACGTTSRPQAWKRIVDFIHRRPPPRSALQLGHAGRKGSTRVAWEGIDQPLDEGNWPLISASALPYLPHGQVPRAMTARRHGPGRATISSRATRRAAAAGVRLARAALRAWLSAVELPLAADQRARRRLRRRRMRKSRALSARGVPRRCARSGRQDKPMSVRLSCHDWAEGGNTPDDAADLRARCSRRRGRRHHRLLVGPGRRRRNSRSTAGCSRRRSPTRSATRSASRRSRSARSPRPITPIRSSPRAAPISARSRARIWPIPPGRCMRRPRSA